MSRPSSWVLAAFIAAVAMGRSQAATDGKSLYVARCAMCHGNDGVAGKLGAGSRNFNDPAFQGETTVAQIATVIHDGKGKMKGLGATLTRQEAESIAAYVLSLPK